MIKRLLMCCLLLTGGSICLAQQPTSKNDDRRAIQRTEAVAHQLSEQIKLMEEPALRVFLRLRGATFLWDAGFADVTGDAEAMTVEAIADLKEHEGEMPAFYAKRFQADLMASLQLRAPLTAARMTKKYGLQQSDDSNQLDTAYSMLNTQNSAAGAVEMVSRSLSSGRDPGTYITFFLDKLRREHSAQVPQILNALLNIEEQKPGSLSLRTLFWVDPYFLSDGTPLDLRRRFLTIVVNAVGNGLAGNNPEQLSFAYHLLNDALPVMERLTPSLYAQARAHLANLSTRIPRAKIDRDELARRISQSENSLEQLIAEANLTNDPILKSSLLREAAQLALKEGQLKLAVDLVTSIVSEEDKDGLWRDQFLSGIVNSALSKKDSALADYATSKMLSPLNRADALQRIALHLLAQKDLVRAREHLREAVELIKGAENNVSKALSLLRIVPVTIKVDDQQVTELVQVTVKVINNIPRPDSGEETGSKARNDYVQSLLQIAWNTIPVFQSLAPRDEIGALALANSIQRQELRSSALLGTSMGSPELRSINNSTKRRN